QITKRVSPSAVSCPVRRGAALVRASGATEGTSAAGGSGLVATGTSAGAVEGGSAVARGRAALASARQANAPSPRHTESSAPCAGLLIGRLRNPFDRGAPLALRRRAARAAAVAGPAGGCD